MRYQLTTVERKVVLGFQDRYDRWWQAEQAARAAEAQEDSQRAAELRLAAQQELATAIDFLRSNPI